MTPDIRQSFEDEMEHILDHELVTRAQRGESFAFDELVTRYHKRVSSLVYRYVEDRDLTLDLVQDIFLKIYTNIKKFKGESSFSTWLFRIAVNDCIDHKRRLKVRKETSYDQFAEQGFEVLDERAQSMVEDRIVQRAERRQIRALIAQLAPDQKMVLVMRIYEDMTFEDIARVLGEPLSTVKSRLYKALEVVGKGLRRHQLIERTQP